MMIIHRGTTLMYLQYSCLPCLSPFAKCLEGVYTISASIFVDVPYRPPYSTDKFISCGVPGPSQWFFHFGTGRSCSTTFVQDKTIILDGTEPHHFSGQSKESHRCCCHGPIRHWQWEILEHQPYFPDLSQFDYDFFAKVKKKKHCEEPGTTQEMDLSALWSDQYGISTKVDALMVYDTSKHLTKGDK